MPQIVIPGTSISYGWQPREQGWGPGMNLNLQVLGQVARGAVLSRTGAVPAEPDEGDSYIVPVGATGAWAGQDNKQAVYLSEAWVFIEPMGMPIYVVDETIHVYWTGSSYAVLAGTGDMSGPGSSTDGAIPAFNGLSGTALKLSGMTMDAAGNLSGHGAAIKTVSTTTYTLQASDNGKILHFTNAAGCTVTAPGPTAVPYGANIQCVLVQKGPAPVTVAEDGESTVHASGDLVATAQLDAMMSIYRYSATDYELGGERA